MTFWKKELKFLERAYEAWKSTGPEEVETRLADVPLSLNLFYAGKDQNIRYWHLGQFPDRSDGMDPRLPRKGDGSEEWQGIIPFEELPAIANPAQGYLVNWNNKPVSWWNNGDTIPWAFDSELLVPSIVTNRVSRIGNFVGPISSFSFEDLKDVPRQIQDHGTYQQAIELSVSEVRDVNIIPPGQSGFVSRTGQRSSHFDDQWPLHAAWAFKDMRFGQPEKPGDFDGDSQVGFSDFLLFARAFGAKWGEDTYHSILDLNGDSTIDFSDFILFTGLFDSRAESE